MKYEKLSYYLFGIFLGFLIGFKANAQQIQHFKVDSSIPTQTLLIELQRIFDEKIKDKKIISIEIEGHTDSRASDTYNQRLSEARSKASAKALIRMGADSSKITTIGKGESQLVSLGSTELDHAKNRRVVVIVKSDKGVSTTIISESGEKKCEETIVETIIERKVIKKHLISLLAVRDITEMETETSHSPTNNSYAGKVRMRAEYVPALSYQYQMDSGFVPMIGINSNLKPFGGIGFEF